jgi:hypothetical protein
LAGISIFPNVAILLGFCLSHSVDTSEWSFILPAVLWLISCIALVIWLAPLSPTVITNAEQQNAHGDSKRSLGIHTASLGFGVLASAVVPSLAIAAVTGLSPGATAVIFLVSRIGTSIVGLGVNSILLVRYNWNVEHGSNSRVYELLVPPALVFGVAGLILGQVSQQQPAAYTCVGLAWILMLVASALIGRESNARRQTNIIALKVGADVVLAVAAVSYLWSAATVTGYFGVFAVSQSVTVLIFAAGLRYRLIAIFAGAMLACSFGMILFGW